MSALAKSAYWWNRVYLLVEPSLPIGESRPPIGGGRPPIGETGFTYW